MKLFITALAVLSLVTTTTFAAGLNGKVYPGSMGVRWTASDPVPALHTSSIENPSSKWLRVDLPEGWVSIRPSNTEPILRVTAEAQDGDVAERLLEQVRRIACEVVEKK